jgi:hypothetical protein
MSGGRSTVTLDFRGDEIVIWDGEQQPIDASITGPHSHLVRLLQGEASPLMEHWRGTLRVKSKLPNPFFPLKVHRLRKLPPGPDARRRRRRCAIAGGLVGAALIVTIAGVLLSR